MEKIYQWIAYHCPKKLRYFITIDAVAKATTGEYSSTVVPEITAMEVIKRIEA
jgi:hypothetical protein